MHDLLLAKVYLLSLFSSKAYAWILPNTLLGRPCPEKSRGYVRLSAQFSLSLTRNGEDEDQNPLEWDINSPPSSDRQVNPQLGINLGALLEPLSEREAAELKAAATEVINDAIAQGIDEIGLLRERMKRELEAKRKSMEFESEMTAQRESAKLMDKIDALTDAFLASTQATRSTTKMAAAADQSMEGKGIDYGTWGNLGGAAVLMGSEGRGTLLGSVNAAKPRPGQETKGSLERSTPSPQSRILIVADRDQDPYAKQLLPGLTEALQKSLPGLLVDIYKPTATVPLGGDNAACVILFCTSLSDKSTLYNLFDRLLRKTLQAGGAVAQPPTQLVGISTIGTARTNIMPYSMQNLMGGKLEKRRQMEEAIITTVKQRAVEPALDYTICKLGDIKPTLQTDFSFAAGDVLDGAISLETAVTVLTQAIAYQPSARNATLSCIGSLPSAMTPQQQQALLDDAFLRLDGPELVRISLKDDVSRFDQLVEYIREWAVVLAESGKGLTTPVRAQVSPDLSVATSGIQRQAGVQLLFLPTATGSKYMSRDEEVERERIQGKVSTKPASSPKMAAREGGVEVVVEWLTGDPSPGLRIRAKRCNYGDESIIKELSEETILSRLADTIRVWEKNH